MSNGISSTQSSTGMAYASNNGAELNANQKVKTKKRNALLNGTLGLAAGAAAGGGLGYYATNLAKNGAPTDKFVRECFIECVVKSADIKQQIIYRRILKSIYEGTTQGEVKSVLEKNKELFKGQLEEFKKSPEKVTSEFNRYRDTLIEPLKQELTEIYDKSKKKFNLESLDLSTREAVESAAKSIKTGNAIKYGAISAIGLGAIAFIATKLSNNNRS